MEEVSNTTDVPDLCGILFLEEKSSRTETSCDWESDAMKEPVVSNNSIDTSEVPVGVRVGTAREPSATA
jgi:hypothetical protein